MVIIRFPDRDIERKALAYLVGRFTFKTWSTGETMVPPAALASLAMERIQFTVEGPATYEQRVPTVRDPSAASVQ